MYHLAVWCTVLFWGISFIATKVVVESFNPLPAAFLRFAIAVTFLILVTKKPLKLDLFSFPLIMAGAWGVTLHFIFENFSLTYTFPTNTSLIVSTVPIFHLIFSHFIQRKKTTHLHYIGSITAFTGISLVILNGRILRLNPLGDILAFGAALSWVIYTYYVEKLDNADSISSTIGILIWGTVFLFPLSLLQHWELKKIFQPDVLLSMLYLGLVCSGLAYFLWNLGIKKLGARYTTNTIYFIPVVTAICEPILLKKLPSVMVLVGTGLAITGLWIFQKAEERLKGQ